MLQVSQRCQYALRAVFELAKRQGLGPISVGEIAAAQATPPRFLEQILGQLRKAGFVTSQRGVQGGYELAVSPAGLTVGTIIRFIDGPIAPVGCIAGDRAKSCPLLGDCAFMGMWQRARDVVAEVYDTTTFQDLVEEERIAAEKYVADFCI